MASGQAGMSWRTLTHGEKVIIAALTLKSNHFLVRALPRVIGPKSSWLDKLRSGPTRVSGPAVRAGIDRLKSVRELGITLPAAALIPESRIAALARFANRASSTPALLGFSG